MQLTPAQAVSWNSHLVAYKDLTMDKTPLLQRQSSLQEKGRSKMPSSSVNSTYIKTLRCEQYVLLPLSQLKTWVHQLGHDFPQIYHKLLVQLMIKRNLIKRRVINIHLGSKPCSSIPAVSNGHFFYS